MPDQGGDCFLKETHRYGMSLRDVCYSPAGLTFQVALGQFNQLKIGQWHCA